MGAVIKLGRDGSVLDDTGRVARPVSLSQGCDPFSDERY